MTDLFEGLQAAQDSVDEKVIRRGRVRTSNTNRGKPGPKIKPKNLEAQIGGLLSVMNMGFYFIPKPWQDDALDAAEIEVLAKTINQAAMDNPVIYKYLSWVFTGGGSTINMVLIAGIIVGKRLARHGVIPPESEAGLTMMLGSLGASDTAVRESLDEADNRDDDSEAA